MNTLVSGFLSRFAPKARSGTPPSVGDRLVYAVGDVHGRLDLLDPLIRQIAADALEVGPSRRPMLVFVGDYVDRGLESKGVIDRILALRADAGFEVRTLKGNHEEAMINFLSNPAAGPEWCEYGGAQTLASYGVSQPKLRGDEAEWELTREAFGRLIPPSHLEFLAGLELILTVGDYAFVHAGLRPGLSIQDQDAHDLMWIRDVFLNERRPFEKVVVHGHTPEEEPFMGPLRIGIDTGAYATGVLTAVRLSGEDRAILQSKASRLG
jgi:serine/threonine protein phosphatase 1